MTQPERTPQSHSQQAPSDTPVDQTPDNQKATALEPHHIHMQGHIREVTIHSYPSHDSHYSSDLSRDIARNPALFWGAADF